MIPPEHRLPSSGGILSTNHKTSHHVGKQFIPQQDHHRLSRGQNQFPNIPRPRLHSIPTPFLRSTARSQSGPLLPLPTPYGLDTMDSSHKSQQSQPSTISSTNSRALRAANAAAYLDLESNDFYHQILELQQNTNTVCKVCDGIIMKTSSDTEKLPSNGAGVTNPPNKSDGSYFNFQNYPYQTTLQRNNSIGGFTLTGQDIPKPKRNWMSRCCSSHKIALVVSTFSFLVTIGLTITLILMKNKGMMEPM